MSKFSDGAKNLFVNPKKRRTIIVVLLIALIILLLLLISRCTYELAHGVSDVTDNYIGHITGGGDGDGTTEPSSPSDTTQPPEDDTTDTTDTTAQGGDPSGSDPIETDPDETDPPESEDPDVNYPGDPGGAPPSDPDTNIVLRPLVPNEKVEYHAVNMLPGFTEDISVQLESKFYKNRQLSFTLKVTKDETQWVNTKLADVLTLTITFDNGSESFTHTGTFAELDGQTFELGKFKSYSTVSCHTIVTMDKNAGNQYINATLEADFIWQAK